MTVAHKAGAVALAVIAPTGVGSVASAESPLSDSDVDHCVLHVESIDSSAQLVGQDLQCFATFGEAMASVGLPYESPGDLPGRESKNADQQPLASSSALLGGGQVAMASGGSLATHFDGSNYTGASITISGTDCGGGWLNLASAWANRISSTYNFCSNVVFYDDIDKTGASRSTPLYGSNLGTFSNRAESVMYAT